MILCTNNTNLSKVSFFHAAEPGRAADAAGASPGLGAIYPAKRAGLLATRQYATFRRWWRPKTPGAPGVDRTAIYKWMTSGQLATQDSWRSRGRPHAVCLAVASCLRPPRFTRLPAAQVRPSVGQHQLLSILLNLLLTAWRNGISIITCSKPLVRRSHVCYHTAYGMLVATNATHRKRQRNGR